jgi:hypothetical protein
MTTVTTTTMGCLPSWKQPHDEGGGVLAMTTTTMTTTLSEFWWTATSL